MLGRGEIVHQGAIPRHIRLFDFRGILEDALFSIVLVEGVGIDVIHRLRENLPEQTLFASRKPSPLPLVRPSAHDRPLPLSQAIEG